jgi:hypothetical protein
MNGAMWKALVEPYWIGLGELNGMLVLSFSDCIMML